MPRGTCRPPSVGLLQRTAMQPDHPRHRDDGTIPVHGCSSCMNMSDTTFKAIDTGRTGDTVPFPDPAAAPLGTDAEAGGAVAHRAPPAPTRATPPPHGPAVAAAGRRRRARAPTPPGRRRGARLTIVGLGLIAQRG
ncbi:MAG: hypothetical protein O9972_51195, partial [Burkholderiales bacterium]|nr:hypothetical protein [Burkholderiales bacterium]